MFHTTIVQIALFNWLAGRHQGLIFEKYSKFFFLKTTRMKLKLGIFTKDIALYKSYVFFLFWSDKNSGCYGNLKFQ